MCSSTSRSRPGCAPASRASSGINSWYRPNSTPAATHSSVACSRSSSRSAHNCWREIVRRGWLLRLVLCLAAVNLVAAGPLLTLAPASRGVFGYALMLTAIGLGAVVGSVLCRYPRKGAMWWLTAAAVGPLVLAFGGPLPLVLVAFVVVGGVQPVHDVLLIRALPREVLGPVSAVEDVMSLAVLPVGQVVGGLLIDRFGPVSTAWLIVCVLAAASLPILRARPGRAGIRSGSPASAGSR